MQEKFEVVEGKVDWKARSAFKHKHGGTRSSFLILGRKIICSSSFSNVVPNIF